MSHPTWVRGLKPPTQVTIFSLCSSHPTWVRGLKRGSMILVKARPPSHPTWVRGLKPVGRMPRAGAARVVAPHVGAWIETSLPPPPQRNLPVAPHVGAWIETCCLRPCTMPDWSHPTWVRGLKHANSYNPNSVAPVAPHVGAWIETIRVSSKSQNNTVAPHVGAWIETRTYPS